MKFVSSKLHVLSNKSESDGGAGGPDCAFSRVYENNNARRKTPAVFAKLFPFIIAFPIDRAILALSKIFPSYLSKIMFTFFERFAAGWRIIFYGGFI